LLAAIYSKQNIEKELPGKNVPFYCLFLLLFVGLLGIVLTGDMFNLYVFLEVASLSAYGMIAMGQDQATLSSFKYLVMGTIGACFYLIGVGYLYIATGSLNMVDLKELLPPLYQSKVIQTAFIFMIVGFGIKIALFPFHAWQPGAYTHSPSTVTIILSTAMAKTSIYAIIRVIFSVFTLDFIVGYLPIFDILCWISVIAMIYGSIYAIRQVNLKKMLAYSSIANVGYIMLGVGLSPQTPLGLTPAVMHVFNHAVIKACMFMTACAFIFKADLWDIRSFEGMGRRMPYTSIAFILASLAMIGMPPSAGFISKWYLLLAAIHSRNYVFVAIIFFSTILMIVYFWRVIEIMYISAGEDSSQSALMDEAPLSMTLPGMILAVLSFAAGIIWMSGVLSPMLDAVNIGFGLGGAS